MIICLDALASVLASFTDHAYPKILIGDLTLACQHLLLSFTLYPSLSHGEGTQWVKTGSTFGWVTITGTNMSIYGLSSLLKGSALKMFWHLTLLPEHLPLLSPVPITLNYHHLQIWAILLKRDKKKANAIVITANINQQEMLVFTAQWSQFI